MVSSLKRHDHSVTSYVSIFLSYSLCNLYNWRYKHLGNLPHVQELPEFQVPNPGLTFDFQLINVEDFNGVGESEPNPYFYQVSTSMCHNIYTHTHKHISYLYILCKDPKCQSRLHNKLKNVISKRCVWKQIEILSY